MKVFCHLFISLFMAILLVLTGSMSAQAAVMGTAFTYQGQLTSSGAPVNGTCAFQFILYDALIDGSQVGSILTKTGVTVTNGLFSISLDFGSSVFTGDARWLQIAAKCGSDASYSTLSPRQELTPTPYALNADLLDGQHAAAFQKDIVLASSTTGATTYLTSTCANYSGGDVTINYYRGRLCHRRSKRADANVSYEWHHRPPAPGSWDHLN